MRKEAVSGFKHENAGDISVRDIIMPLFRQKRLIMVVFFSVLSVVLLLATLQGASYTSRMTILVNRERQDPLVSTEATTQTTTGSTPLTSEEINSEVELLKSRDVLEQVVSANKLAEAPKGFSIGTLLHPHRTDKDRMARAVTTLAKQLKIAVATKTNIIDISYSSSDPQRSYGVLKSLGDYYGAKHVAVHRPAGSYDFFAEETAKYHDQLEIAETKLKNFGIVNGVAAPDVQRTNLALQAAESVGLEHLAEQAIAAAEERIRSDREQMNATPQRSLTAQVSASADKLLTELEASLVKEQIKRSQLVMKYDASYPLVKEADLEISQIKASIKQAKQTRYVTETTDRDSTYELLREDLAKSKADIAAQRANLVAIRRSIQSIQKRMVDLDQKSISQQDLLREAKSNENNYLLYLSKREQERVTDALDRTRIANVAIAVPPAIPALPVYSWSMIIIVAFGLATAASVCTAFAVNYLDSSFHTPAQVVDILGVPVVVSVSRKQA